MIEGSIQSFSLYSAFSHVISARPHWHFAGGMYYHKKHSIQQSSLTRRWRVRHRSERYGPTQSDLTCLAKGLR